MTNRSEYALELWISTELMPKNRFYKAKMKIFKKCIPLACESVYREIFVPETMRLSSKQCDLRGLLLDGRRVVQCSDKFMHGIVLS